MKKQSVASSTPTTVIEIPAPDIQMLRVKLVGDSELICHRFSAKVKNQILDKQMKKAKSAKMAKDPEADFRDSLYPMPGRSDAYGFKSGAFKEAAIFACSHVDGVTKVHAKGAFHVMGYLVELQDAKTGKPCKPIKREDNVRIGRGIADIRHRGEFRNWAVELTIRYNQRVMSSQQIVNLLNTAGFCSGVGEWRPSSPIKTGPFGMFHVTEVHG